MTLESDTCNKDNEHSNKHSSYKTSKCVYASVISTRIEYMTHGHNSELYFEVHDFSIIQSIN